MDFGEGLKKAFLAGVGLAAFAAENAGKTVDTLAKKGEEVAHSNKVVNDSREYAKKVHDDISEDIRNSGTKKHFDDVISAVDNMTKEDREKLREKLEETDKAARTAFDDAVKASKEKFDEWKNDDSEKTDKEEKSEDGNEDDKD